MLKTIKPNKLTTDVKKNCMETKIASHGNIKAEKLYISYWRALNIKKTSERSPPGNIFTNGNFCTYHTLFI